MCGITGYCGTGKSVKIVTGMLKLLEYRGYDSTGIAWGGPFSINRFRVLGKVNELVDLLKSGANYNTSDVTCIGHVRWATHGAKTKENAHPHISQDGNVCLVHNGIIENAEALREQFHLKNLEGQTDSEVAANIIATYIEGLKDIDSITEAIKCACEKFMGSYAFAIIINQIPGIFCVRYQSPLVIGRDDKGNKYISSATLAFPKAVNNVLYTNEYEVYHVTDTDPMKGYIWEKYVPDNTSDIGNYSSYMEKEIAEQAHTPNFIDKELKAVKIILKSASKIIIIGCGTSYHAGLYGKRQLMKAYGHTPVEVWQASEFRYEDTEHHAIYDDKAVFIFISQSGETADTLACLNKVHQEGNVCISILNCNDSSMHRASDFYINIGVGPEQAVASTKAYMGQCALFNAICDGQVPLDTADINSMNVRCSEIPQIVKELLLPAENIYFIGRKADYIQCMEGALKMKEITYTPSEAYPAGELKHGPIAMITDKSVVIALCSYDKDIFEKMKSSIKEVQSRGAKVIFVYKESLDIKDVNADYAIRVTDVPHADLLAIVALQKLALGLAVEKGNDVDKPRNLAKAVTVE